MYRVAKPGETALLHPETGTYVVPDPRIPYRGDDPLVKAFPQFFISDEDMVETTEQRPGEKRNLPPGVYEGNI
jgi:hypothetical protein